MRNFITVVFIILLVATFWITLIVGASWLFDFKPNNLYLFWSVCYNSLVVSFLFYLLFGEKLQK
jgi:hypothetical protein